jgi:hypothetical protein
MDRGPYVVVLAEFCIPHFPARATTGRASNCHTERRKTKREDREVTIEAMLVDGG